jgi:hypothetical protein
MVFVLVPLLITKEGERALGLRPIGQSLSKRGNGLDDKGITDIGVENDNSR